jgi:hypothetical protein
MANDYDKIFKENIAALFLPLSEKYLGIKITRSEELKDKLQTTIEKEPDFLRIVETDTEERFILHLEFQSADEDGMIYRMQEYYGILRKKYKLPVKQFVVYLGQRASSMQTRLAPEEVFTGFTLKSLREYDHQSLLSSDVPEEIILAILTDFEGNKAEDVLKSILLKLQAVSEQEITLRKYIRQLAMLARLRNLVQETQNQVKNMGLTYNITEDPLYQEGLLKGEEKGQKVREKSLITEMLRDGTLTVEKIASLAKVPVDYVKQVAGELNQ